MKTLVLGATGQLGSNLVRALVAKGDQVRALVRPTSKTFTLDGLDIERVTGDLNDPDSLVRACEHVQVVYQTASYYPPATIPVAETVEDVPALPGWKLHALRGDRKGQWSITVTGNWRIVFEIIDNQISNLNLEDYH